MKMKRLISLVAVTCLILSLVCVTATADSTCNHTYSGACDDECNLCGAIRIATEHFFGDDDLCDGCGLSRKINLPGDVNADGKVNNKDLGVLRQYLNNWEVTIDERASDVNADGKVNNKDMGILRQYLNNWDVTLKDPQGGNLDVEDTDNEKGWLEGWY